MKVMRTTVATVVAATLSMSAFSAFAAASLTGAGATFPAPVYAKWADTYQKETGSKVNYQWYRLLRWCKTNYGQYR